MMPNKNTKDASEQLASSSKQTKFSRKCVACDKFFERKNLLKIQKEHKTNELIINPNSNTFGRSAYICYNKDCLNIAIKKNRFQKALRMKISEDFFEQLKKMIN